MTQNDARPAQPKGKTPYQGRMRCFGEFMCTKCEKTWSSGNSWANKGQECKECRINIYPHRQRPLERRRSKKAKKPHLEELCEKCKDLGHSCLSLPTHSKKKRRSAKSSS